MDTVRYVELEDYANQSKVKCRVIQLSVGGLSSSISEQKYLIIMAGYSLYTSNYPFIRFYKKVKNYVEF